MWCPFKRVKLSTLLTVNCYKYSIGGCHRFSSDGYIVRLISNSCFKDLGLTDPSLVWDGNLLTLWNPFNIRETWVKVEILPSLSWIECTTNLLSYWIIYTLPNLLWTVYYSWYVHNLRRNKPSFKNCFCSIVVEYEIFLTSKFSDK